MKEDYEISHFDLTLASVIPTINVSAIVTPADYVVVGQDPFWLSDTAVPKDSGANPSFEYDKDRKDPYRITISLPCSVNGTATIKHALGSTLKGIELKSSGTTATQRLLADVEDYTSVIEIPVSSLEMKSKWLKLDFEITSTSSLGSVDSTYITAYFYTCHDSSCNTCRPSHNMDGGVCIECDRWYRLTDEGKCEPWNQT